MLCMAVTVEFNLGSSSMLRTAGRSHEYVQEPIQDDSRHGMNLLYSS